MNELTQIKQSHQLLEQELEEARRKIEEEAKQFQSKGNEDKSLLRRMQEELAEREVQLVAKEKEVCDIQVLVQLVENKASRNKILLF